MVRRVLSACGLILVLAAAPGPADAGEVRLSIKDGRVALVARDATLREILIEWERVGGTRIVNRDRVPGTRLTLDFPNVPEEEALATLLRPVAGYIASLRVGPGGASEFSRIVIMPGEATPPAYLAVPATAVQPPPTGPSGGMSGPSGGMSGPPFGRPGMQRRVLPDGRVVTVMDDQSRANENDDADEAAPGNQPGMMRPPFGAPGRGAQGQTQADTPQPEVQPYQVTPTGTTAPGVPPTTSLPGERPPAKPGAATPAPPKPPGD